jgi:hypothetical protein
MLQRFRGGFIKFIRNHKKITTFMLSSYFIVVISGNIFSFQTEDIFEKVKNKSESEQHEHMVCSTIKDLNKQQNIIFLE